ncbi:hypothetical protein, partial [Alistipes finegoldii]
LVPLLFPPLPASKLSFSSAVLFFPSGGLSRPAAVFLFSPASFFFLRRFSFSLCSLSCPATVFLGVLQGRGIPPASFSRLEILQEV